MVTDMGVFRLPMRQRIGTFIRSPCFACFLFYLKSFCVRSQKEMVFESISSDENCLLRINFIFDEAGGCFLKKKFDPHQTRMVLISFFSALISFKIAVNSFITHQGAI